jgi:hypothetical protein
MFPKKSKPTAPAKQAPKKDLKALLQEAFDRNSSIGIVRLGKSGQDPLAQGRMLEWTNGKMVLEELQVIGKAVDLRVGDRVEAFLSVGKTMLTFESKITMLEMPKRLNEKRVVRSLELTNPMQLREGDRRSAYRASISALTDDIAVKMWFIDRLHPDVAEAPPIRMEHTNTYYTELMAAKRFESLIPLDEEGNEPIEINWVPVMECAKIEAPHAVGRLIDLTANGLGVVFYGVSSMQLDRFERIVMSFELDGEQIELVSEVRHGDDLRGSTCKIGFLLVYPDGRNVHAVARRSLERYAMQIQRDQLKSRKAS